MQKQDVFEKIILACRRRLNIVSKYCNLATLPTLSENDAQRMDRILRLAERDPLLSFLLDETDHILGHELGLINASEIHEQQNHLQQAIDKHWISIMLTSILPENENYLKQAQVYLQRAGFYDGPIDGEYNSLTQEAFSNLRQEIRHRYQLLGNKYCSAAGTQYQDFLERIVIGQEQENDIDSQESDLRSLEVWKNCEYHDNAAY